MPLISFLLDAMARISKGTGESAYLRRKAFNFCHLSMVLAMGLFHMVITLKVCVFTLNFFENLVMSRF